MILQGRKCDMVSPYKMFAIILGAVALTDAAVIPGNGTCVYNDRNCPVYHNVSVAAEYELREYEPASWIATSETVTEYTSNVSREMYFRLKNYFDGNNANNDVIDRTVPVLTMREDSAINGPTKYTKYFLVDSNAPEPTGNDVYKFSSPAYHVYVRTYGGKPTYAEKETELEHLKGSIADATLYDPRIAFFAGYNPPWIVNNRRNEVGVKAATQPTTQV